MQGWLRPVCSLAPGDLDAWQALGDRSAEPNPMNEPGFVLSATEHQVGGEQIQLVAAHDGGRLLGAFPVTFAKRYGNLRIPLLTTGIRRMTYLGTPLVDPDGGRDVVRTLLDTLSRARHDSGHRLLAMEWLGEGGPVAAWVRQAAEDLGLPVFTYERFDQPFLARRPDGDYQDLTSTKHRKDYERRARRLQDTLGAELELVDRAGDRSAIERFMCLEAAGYKTGIGVAMHTRPGEPEYFLAMCDRLAAQGRLHVLELRAGTRTVAMQLSVRGGDTLFLIKVSHDEELARFDPGIQLHLRAIEYFDRRTDARAIRVGTFADNALLLRLYPERRSTATLLIGLGGRLDHAVVRALPAARSISRRLRHRAVLRRSSRPSDHRHHTVHHARSS